MCQVSDFLNIYIFGGWDKLMELVGGESAMGPTPSSLLTAVHSYELDRVALNDNGTPPQDKIHPFNSHRNF